MPVGVSSVGKGALEVELWGDCNPSFAGDAAVVIGV